MESKLELAKDIYQTLREAADIGIVGPYTSLSGFYNGELSYPLEAKGVTVSLIRPLGDMFIEEEYRGAGFTDSEMERGIFSVTFFEGVTYLGGTYGWQWRKNRPKEEFNVSLPEKCVERDTNIVVPIEEKITNPINKVSLLSLIPQIIVSEFGSHDNFLRAIDSTGIPFNPYGIEYVDRNKNMIYNGGLWNFCKAFQTRSLHTPLKTSDSIRIGAGLPGTPLPNVVLSDLVRAITRNNN
jgi:hypothetical protein